MVAWAKAVWKAAEAMRTYARQAQDPEMCIWAAEIKLRAERRAGEMLNEMEKASVPDIYKDVMLMPAGDAMREAGHRLGVDIPLMAPLSVLIHAGL